MTINKIGEIVTNLVKDGKLNGIINSLPKDRFPATDEMDDDFVNAGENIDIVPEHEDLVFEQQEKEMDKINHYFDMQNEIIYEGREIDPSL